MPNPPLHFRQVSLSPAAASTQGRPRPSSHPPSLPPISTRGGQRPHPHTAASRFAGLVLSLTGLLLFGPSGAPVAGCQHTTRGVDQLSGHHPHFEPGQGRLSEAPTRWSSKRILPPPPLQPQSYSATCSGFFVGLLVRTATLGGPGEQHPQQSRRAGCGSPGLLPCHSCRPATLAPHGKCQKEARIHYSRLPSGVLLLLSLPVLHHHPLVGSSPAALFPPILQR